MVRPRIPASAVEPPPYPSRLQASRVRRRRLLVRTEARQLQASAVGTLFVFLKKKSNYPLDVTACLVFSRNCVWEEMLCNSSTGFRPLTPVAFFLPLMYLCYVDESGTPEIPGNTSHFVLAGLAIPIWHWTGADKDIEAIKRSFGLQEAELHTAWLLREYPEQDQIQGFEDLDWAERRRKIKALRDQKLIDLQNSNSTKKLREKRKLFAKTNSYIHLTIQERRAFITAVAEKIGSWGYARIFAECINKVHFSPADPNLTPTKQAFEQLISRFETYLTATGATGVTGQKTYGLVIHDNNETVAKKHTELMKRFHREGTLFTNVRSIIETPLFVNSELTSIIQLADLCSYVFRRYLENGEDELLHHIFPRIHRRNGVIVGIRHYTPTGCTCRICEERGRNDS